jgi:hypothetical protein
MEETKICRKCSRDLPRNKEFYNFMNSSSKCKIIIAAYCRECTKRKSAEYFQKRREEGSEARNGLRRPIQDNSTATIRYENEKLTDCGLRKCVQCQEVKPRDKEHFRWDAAGSNFFGKCHECDGNHKFRNAYRGRIATALKNNKRDGRVEKMLGCSVSEGRKHIESTWKPGMNWANHGLHGWHIDHIRPCASFDFSRKEEQRVCFDHKNLQALWAKENLKKGAKWEQ